MSTTDIKEVVKERYGKAALRVKTGGSGCCGATAASGLGCDPGGSISAFKTNAACGKRIDVWSTNSFVAIATRVVRAKGVDRDDNHIRPWFDGAGKPETKERSRQNSEEQNRRETMGCTNYATESVTRMRLSRAGTVLV